MNRTKRTLGLCAIQCNTYNTYDIIILFESENYSLSSSDFLSYIISPLISINQSYNLLKTSSTLKSKKNSASSLQQRMSTVES